MYATLQGLFTSSPSSTGAAIAQEIGNKTVTRYRLLNFIRNSTPAQLMALPTGEKATDTVFSILWNSALPQGLIYDATITAILQGCDPFLVTSTGSFMDILLLDPLKYNPDRNMALFYGLKEFLLDYYKDQPLTPEQRQALSALAKKE
jgi:hypothetical protein